MTASNLLADVVSNDDWGVFPALSDKVVAVQTNDGDSSYIVITNDGSSSFIMSYFLQPLPVIAGKITKVGITQVGRIASGFNMRPRMSLNTPLDGSVGQAQQSGSSSYNTATDPDLTRPAGDWSRSVDFPGGGVGARIVVDNFPVDNGEQGRVTQMFCTVTFNIQPRGFVHAIACWIPPLMAVASHAVIPREMAQFFRGWKHRPSFAYEYAAISRALLVRPRFV